MHKCLSIKGMEDRFQYMSYIHDLLNPHGTVLNDLSMGKSELNLPEYEELMSSDRNESGGNPNEPVMPAPWIAWNSLQAMPEGQNLAFRSDATPDPKTVDTKTDDIKEMANDRAPWQGQKPEGKSSDIQPTGSDSLDWGLEPKSGPFVPGSYEKGVKEATEKMHIAGAPTPMDAYGIEK